MATTTTYPVDHAWVDPSSKQCSVFCRRSLKWRRRANRRRSMGKGSEEMDCRA